MRERERERERERITVNLEIFLLVVCLMKVNCVSFKYDEIVRHLVHMAVNELLKTAFDIA